MTFTERLKTGQYCVPLHYDARMKKHNAVGDIYAFNNQDYKVVEVCSGDLDGFCWIGLE